MRTIIIDDEKDSHITLSHLLQNCESSIQLVGSAYNVAEGIRLINDVQPELVFLDVEMPDGTGFDLLQQFSAPSFIVIFITAHNRYAVSAIRAGAIDFLEKPIDDIDELEAAIGRARNAKVEKISREQLDTLFSALREFENKKLPTRTAISTLEGVHYRHIMDIIRLEAKQNYTEFSWKNDKKLLASLNLKKFEEQYEVYDYIMRAHRSHIVNLHHVETFVKSDGGYLEMVDGSKVPVSRAYREEVLAGLANL